MPVTVEEVSKVIDYAVAEFEEIHKLCDMSGVAPRTDKDGSKFSAAQRVHAVVATLEHFAQHIIKQRISGGEVDGKDFRSLN